MMRPRENVILPLVYLIQSLSGTNEVFLLFCAKTKTRKREALPELSWEMDVTESKYGLLMSTNIARIYKKNGDMTPQQIEDEVDFNSSDGIPRLMAFLDCLSMEILELDFARM